MRRWLLSLFLVPIVLIIVLLALLLALLMTDSGLRFLHSQASYWVEGVEVGSSQGNLWQGFELKDIRYDNPQNQVSIALVRLDWDNSRIWDKTFHVNALDAKKIKVVQTGVPAPEPEQPSEPMTELADIELPLAIKLEHIQINDIEIQAPDGKVQRVDEVILSADIDKQLALQNLSIKAPEFSAKAQGEFDLYNPHPLDLTLDWQAQLPENPDLPSLAQGQAQIQGDFEKLSIKHQAQAPLSLNLDVEVRQPLKKLAWQAQIDWQNLRWPLNPEQAAQVESPQGLLQLQGDLNAWQLEGKTAVKGGQVPATALNFVIKGSQTAANIENFHADVLKGTVDLSGDVAWQDKPTAELKLEVAGISIKDYWADWADELGINTELALHFADDKLNITDLNLSLPPSKALAQGQVQVDLSGAEPDIQTDLTWQQIQWPLTGDALAEIATGKLNFTGTPKAYQLALETQVDGESIPAGTWALTGQGDAEKLEDLQLTGKLLEGQLDLTGQAAWAPSPFASLDLASQEIDLTELWADWPAALRLAQNLHLEFADNKLEISDLKISLPPEQTQISGQAQVDLNQEPISLAADLDWQAVQWPLVSSDSPALAELKAGKLSLTGTLDAYQLELNTDINTPELNNAKLRLNAEGDQQQLTQFEVLADLLQGHASIEGTAAWQPELKAQAQVATEGIRLSQFVPELSEERLNTGFAVSFAQQQLKIKELSLNLLPHPLALKGSAEVQLPSKPEQAPQINAALNWKAIQWPLNLPAEEAQVQLPVGQLSFKGTPDDYTVEMDTDVEGKDLPPSQWQALITGNSQQAKIEKIDSQLLAGTLHSAGTVQWQPHLNWDIKLSGKDLNPAEKWAEWPGKLGLNIQTQGQQKQGEALKAEVNIEKIGGKLRDYPLKLTGKLEAGEKGYQVKKLRFNSGDAKLAADLSMDTKERLKGTLDINIADLGQVLPKAKGSIKGKGTIAGTVKDPSAKLNINAKGIKAQGQKLEQLEAQLNLSQGQKIQLSLTADKLRQGEQVLLNKLGLKLKGKLNKHQLTADIDSPQAQVALALNGGVNDKQQWRGQINTLKLESPEFDTWQLTQAVPVEASAEQAKLQNFCWQAQQSQAQFCLKGGWSPVKGTQVNLDIASLPFTLLKSVLPETTEIDGGIQGTVNARISPDGKLNNQIDLELTRGEVRSWFAGEQHRFPFQGGTINLSMDKNGTQAQTDLRFLEHSLIKGRLRLPQFKQLNFNQDQRLEGNLQIQLADLGILPSLVPQLENTSGQLSVDLTLDGQLSQPNMRGQAVLKAASDLPVLGLELRDLHTYIDAQGEQIHISGGVQSGEGKTEWQGNINLVELSNWQAALSLKGERFTLMNNDGIQALLNSDLKIEANPKALDIQGQIAIPEAMISPNIAAMGGLSDNAVAVSEDAIIIDTDSDTTTKKDKTPAMKITAKVLVLLNEDIILDVADFKSSIDGALLISLQENGELTGNGAVQIVNGTYRAYGQDLKIHQGFIIFPDVPLADPVLNIKAVRKIHGDTNEPPVEEAGLHITGSGSLPVVSLFSEPMTEEANILSYIVTGAALAGDVKRSSLSLGTYVAPHIYASFGLDLFDQSKEFTVRYDISKKWGVDATVGDRDSGVDITYSIGR